MDFVARRIVAWNSVMGMLVRIMLGMVNRRSGHIVNIGSIAGKETYLKGNVYCATKHSVAGRILWRHAAPRT